METIILVPNEIKTAINNMGNFEGRFNLNKSGFNSNKLGHTSNQFMVLRQAGKIWVNYRQFIL